MAFVSDGPVSVSCGFAEEEYVVAFDVAVVGAFHFEEDCFEAADGFDFCVAFAAKASIEDVEEEFVLGI